MASRRANTSRHAISRRAQSLSDVRLRREEADRAVDRPLLERELRPDLPDPEPASRRGVRRAPAREAARKARPPRLTPLTDKGARLRRWLVRRRGTSPCAASSLLKLFLGVAGPVADSVAQIEHYQARQQELLETYIGIKSGGSSRRWRTIRSTPSRLVALHHGQHRCRAMLAWCAETLRAPAAPRGAARPPAALRRSSHGKPDRDASIAPHRGRHGRALRRAAAADAHREGRAGPPSVGQDLFLGRWRWWRATAVVSEPLASPDLPHAARRLQLLPGVCGIPGPPAQAPGPGRRARGDRLAAALATFAASAALVVLGFCGPARAGSGSGSCRSCSARSGWCWPGSTSGSSSGRPQDERALVVRAHGGMLGLVHRRGVRLSPSSIFGFLPIAVRWIWPTIVGTR